MTNEFHTTTELIAEAGSKYIPSPIEKSISASQLGNDLLQLYLAKTTTQEEEVFEIGQAELGSIFHLGMEAAAKQLMQDPNSNILHVEHSMVKELPNGWFLTGTIDLISKEGDKVVLSDHKLTKQYASKMIKEAIRKNQPNSYITQLNAYRLMYDENAEMKLELFLKDQNILKDEPAYEQIQVPVLNGIEQTAVDITNKLQEYLDNKTVPEICSDLWWRKVGNSSIKTRCKFYCNVKNVCPYYQDSMKNPYNMAKNISNW
ncbi:MAG: PD-(D/E)XK nuclease family protein [Candidatus Heimdallarchaeaceae archaeon]